MLQLDGVGVASGGLRELIPCIARTCVAVGVDGIFMEVGFLDMMCFSIIFSKISHDHIGRMTDQRSSACHYQRNEHAVCMMSCWLNRSDMSLKQCFVCRCMIIHVKLQWMAQRNG